MRPAFTSRTATRVKNGRVQPKNRRRPTSHLGCVIDRESPGHGATKGEDYAEHFANSRFETLLPLYIQLFGPPQTAP